MSQPTLPPLKVYRVTTTHGQFKVLASPSQAARLKQARHSASLGQLPPVGDGHQQAKGEYMKRIRKSSSPAVIAAADSNDETKRLKSMVRTLTHKLRKYKAKVAEQEQTIDSLRTELNVFKEQAYLDLKLFQELSESSPSAVQALENISPGASPEASPSSRSLCELEKRQEALVEKPQSMNEKLTKKFKLAVKPTELSDALADSQASPASSSSSSLSQLQGTLQPEVKPLVTLDQAIHALELEGIEKPPLGRECLCPLSKLSPGNLDSTKTAQLPTAASHSSARLEIGKPSWRHSPLFKQPLSPSSSKSKLKLVPLKDAIKAARLRMHLKPAPEVKEKITAELSKSQAEKAKIRRRVRSELASQIGDLS